MIFKPSKYLTLIVYQDQNSPRCYEINEKTFKFFIYLVSGITVASLLALGGTAVYFKALRERLEQSEPAIIQQMRQEAQALKVENSELSSFTEELQQKLNSSSTPVDAILPTFALPAGYRDLTSQKQASIEDFKISRQPHSVTVRFNVVNNLQGDRALSGHIFVILKFQNQVHLYPKMQEKLDGALTSFQLGETFTVSRFRPVNATLPLTLTAAQEEELSARIVIFSRSGDLIYSSGSF